MKLKNSKYVTDYFVKLMPNGVYNLVFNMTERWLNAHRYSNEMYIFGDELFCNQVESQSETIEDHNKRIQEIPKFLPVLKKGHFITSQLVDKDQINFFFIPFYSEWIQNSSYKIILNSKNK